MLISYFYPNRLHALFIPYAKKHQFQLNYCTEKADLIYCGSASQLGNALAAKEKHKKPLICWVWDLPYGWRSWTRDIQEFQANAHRDRQIKAIIAMLKACDKVLCGSKYTQRILKEKYSIESEQLYFYIDTEGIDGTPPHAHASGHIIQISRFALNKRFDNSIRAAAGIGQKLICAGTGRYNKLENLARELNADVEFYCNKSTETVMGLLKSAGILVSPSLHEGWGMTPIEALYCGIPVLLSDLEVFKEIYGDKVPYHRKDDINDMKKKIQQLLDDKELQKKIVKDCRPLIESFTAAKFAKRWEKAIA
ncbi:MAG: glycosyltransferase family 4 protein [Gammaproteobacteria bacterium]|nr:glycosyltransferase family 4 protein [Gammaproteobacteria bacterium]